MSKFEKGDYVRPSKELFDLFCMLNGIKNVEYRKDMTCEILVDDDDRVLVRFPGEGFMCNPIWFKSDSVTLIPKQELFLLKLRDLLREFDADMGIYVFGGGFIGVSLALEGKELCYKAYNITADNIMDYDKE